ncbi:MAG TPA: (2Fe-2S)-binding protein [Thermomicrobiales bacterium]|nr:(2Fe-2S)-binding protein [Thermomicrobiales bacterium]
MTTPDKAPASPRVPVTLRVNGSDHHLLVEPRHTLLDTLREDLRLTGTKKVCDMGNCGACTVHQDGHSVYSCLTLAVEANGSEVRTVEGLADAGELDPVQEAFIRADAFQCGFCTPGQLMSLRALLDARPDPTDEEIAKAVTGNLCRCGAYHNIMKAGRLAAEIQAERRATGNGPTAGMEAAE